MAESEIEKARGEIRKLELHLLELDRARRNHLTQMRVAVERQLSEISAAENAPSPQIPTLARQTDGFTESGVAEQA